jgi:branched-subunit amino acid ABC-type transport system permease component
MMSVEVLIFEVIIMKDSISIYLKYQVPYLLFLVAIFVVPLALFFQFSTLELPKVQYAVLVMLFVSQYVFYREKDYQAKIEKRVAETLKKELGRVPSNKEINARSIKVTYYRGVSIVITALCVVILMLIFQKF